MVRSKGRGKSRIESTAAIAPASDALPLHECSLNVHTPAPAKGKTSKRPRTAGSQAEYDRLNQLKSKGFAIPISIYNAPSTASSKRLKTTAYANSIATSIKSNRSNCQSFVEIQNFSAAAFQSSSTPRDGRQGTPVSRHSRADSVTLRPISRDSLRPESRYGRQSTPASRSGPVTVRPTTRDSVRPESHYGDLSRDWKNTDWAALETFLRKNGGTDECPARLSDHELGRAFAMRFGWPEALVRKRVLVLRIKQRKKEMMDTADETTCFDEPPEIKVSADRPERPTGLWRRLAAYVWSR